MARVNVPLKHGLKIGKTVFKNAVLREVESGDIIDAHEESEKLVSVVNAKGELEHVFVPSPTMVGVHILRRQIFKIGDVLGPFELSDIKRFHPDDLNTLQEEANQMDSAAVNVLEDISERGRNDASDDTSAEHD
jgi:phage FluMu protein gp41